ncbi:MAG: FtsQ-type POTRA domain-containing protein [Bacilli bacterium]|nr:FtsQ-type POTRA domain-containing protein [Bacilli bacterium]
MKKKVRKRLNIKRTIVFLLFIYIIGYLVYFMLNQPIKHIEISGNSRVSDNEILRISKLENYPSIFKYRTSTIEKRIKTIELVNEVKVKKWFGFKVIIEVDENELLFYYKNTDNIAISSGNIIKNNYNNVYGLPILLNDVDKDLLKKFIISFGNIKTNIISEMNTIEYKPLYNSENVVISDNRFVILMNDGNTIEVNTNSLSVLNKYNDIYASLDGKKGTISLDTNKLSSLVFIPYEE